jgi:hypothetical protein
MTSLEQVNTALTTFKTTFETVSTDNTTYGEGMKNDINKKITEITEILAKPMYGGKRRRRTNKRKGRKGKKSRKY